MVESLRELNRICQKPRYKEVGNWMVRHILRKAALPLTWLLLHTPVTANQVTAASIFVGLSGIFLFAFSSRVLFLTGALLMQFWYLLDHVDGQIARYRGASSLTGRFFDYLMHHLIHGIIFFSLGLYGFQKTKEIFFILGGSLCCFSIMLFNLIQDTKYKTFFEKLTTFKAVKISSKVEGTEGAEKKNFARRAFSLLHKSCEIHVLMNVLTLAALLEIVFILPVDSRLLLFGFYGIAVPTITITKIVYVILSRGVDREFETYFQTSE